MGRPSAERTQAAHTRARSHNIDPVTKTKVPDIVSEDCAALAATERVSMARQRVSWDRLGLAVAA